MKEIQLVKMVCDNFRCFTHKEIYFFKNTIVKARNKSGKSTLYNAMLWCLFDKDSLGNSATNVRPHDKYGKDIDNIDISVSCTFDVDGREITLTKTQKQKWTKRRGTDETIFDGNVNEFFVNGIPKTQKDYKAYISENFCDEDTFLSCTNAMSFFRLDTKKRREKLMKLASTITNSQVIATNKDFVELSDMFADGTVEELIARSRKAIKGLNDLLVSIPTRIDEQNKSKVDIDIAELELHKKSLSDELKEYEEKYNDLIAQRNNSDDLGVEVMQLKFDINDLKRREHDKLIKQRRELEDIISNYEMIVSKLQGHIDVDNSSVESIKKSMELLSNQEEYLVKQLDEIKSRKINTNELVCEYCGQPYQQDKKKQIISHLKIQKQEEISDIENRIVEIEKQLQDYETLQKESNERISVKSKEIKKISKEIEKLKAELNKIPDFIDLQDNKEFIRLSKELIEKESLLSNNNLDDEIIKITDFKRNTRYQIDEVNEQIQKAIRNNDIDERIAELQKEQRETAQKIANEERLLDLLDRFNRKKMQMLTDTVNKNFKFVKWKLFRDLLNGGTEDFCIATVDGSNVESGLNDSDSIIAFIDILDTFQGMNDVSLPLFLDRAECINESRIPETKGQLIVLKVSDDKEMVVE